MVNIQYVIFYISVFVWLLPPFKQYRTDYFYFFLILAIADPFKLIFYYAGDYSPVDISFFFLTLLCFSLFIPLIKRYYLAIIILALIFSYLGNHLSTTVGYFTKVLAYSYLLVVFMMRMSKQLVQFGIINIFYFVIILYTLSIILKFITLIFDLNTGTIYFYLTSAFQILIALFFIFFNVDDKKIQFRLKSE